MKNEKETELKMNITLASNYFYDKTQMKIGSFRRSLDEMNGLASEIEKLLEHMKDIYGVQGKT